MGDMDCSMKHSTSFIVTKRLWLREIGESDTDTIVTLRSDPMIYRYFSNPHTLTREEHEKWYWEFYVNNNRRMEWIAVDDESGKVTGIFGAEKSSYFDDVAEVSYLLNPSLYGNGYATEAVKGVMDWGSDKWRIRYFDAVIHRENEVSLVFVKRLGFSLVEEQGDFVRYRFM